ncbi:hypothetical protein D915_000280 [Fasciola hepatica]|uniref:CUB domain-containing protein n=1 Tax=Fasciola hepatica TaxID=6192 RepID=A0A4E0RIW3_FASHE|nr:hypothetical protein D915_000280 [Fasciola hepatica]
MWMIHMNQDEETSFELFYSKPRIFVDVMIWTMDHDHLHLVAKVRLRYGDREHFVLNRTILVLFDTRDMAQSSEVILRYQKNSRKVYGSNTVRGVTNLSGKNVSQCGEQLLSPRGNISSPSYPKHYSSDISCLWYIKAHTNEEITIKVIDLEVSAHFGYPIIVINQPSVPNTLELPEEHEPKSLTEENLQKDPTPSDLDIRNTPSTDSKANTEGRPFAYCLNVLIILSYILA